MPQDLQRARELFLHAVGQLPPEQWDAYLAEACGADDELRRQAAHLLQVHRQAGSFLDRPAAGLPATGDISGGPEGGMSAFRPETAGTAIGPYKLLELIGEGGMGTVWMARQTAPVRRLVALKLIKAGMDSKQVLARFEAERQALALMDHPNIAKVLDAGTTAAGRPYFVMELVKGVSITRYCDEHRLTPRQRLELFVPVCRAVQHAHQKGIIHRDLKPSNVLIALYDGRPVPKIIDFGVAKAAGQSLTEQTLVTGFGAIVGTLEYMSPEQAEINQLDIDTRSDIYSLGVLLYELLAGSTPFSRKEHEKGGVFEMLRVIREQEPTKPSAKLSTAEGLPTLAAVRGTEPARLTRLVRGELDWIVMKALEKDRGRRYETANGLATDVRRYLAGEPVLAAPASPWYRLRKFVRRNRGPVSAAGFVLLALVAGVIGTTAGMLQANRAALQEGQARIREAQRADGERKAKVEADRKRKEAERNLAFARKGNAILGSVFAGLDPKRIAESGRPLQDVLRENLHKAVQELEGAALGEPLEVAAMQNTLGLSLLGLGEYALAIEVFGKVRKTCRARLGPDHPDTLTSMNNLAGAYENAGQLDKALPLYEETLRLRKARLGAGHPDTLTSMNNLAGAYENTGQLDRALPLYEETLRLRKARLGPGHPSTLTSMNNLALGYLAAGQPDLALPLFEQTLELTKGKLGRDHPHTLTSMNNLALGYHAARQLDKALPLYEETLQLRKAKLGAGHPDTLTGMSNLASGYRAARQLDKALPLFGEALQLQKAKLGPDHPRTLLTMHNLAGAYEDAGKLGKALPLYEETLRLRQVKLGPGHPDTLTSMGSLASAYRAARQPDKVPPPFEELLRLQRAKLGPGHPRTLDTMNDLATAYWRLKRLDQSIPLLETTLRLREKKLGRQHLATLVTVANLGVNYRDAGRLPEAVALLEEAYRASGKHPSLSWVSRPLQDAYAKTGAAAKLTDLLLQELSRARKSLPEGDPQLAHLLAQIGLGLLRQNKGSEAEPLLRECLAIRARTQPDDWTTFSTQSLLGGALLGRQKYAEAEPLLLKGYAGMRQRAKTIPPQGALRLPEAIDRLIELYTMTNRPGEAKKWRAERAKYPEAKKAVAPEK